MSAISREAAMNHRTTAVDRFLDSVRAATIAGRDSWSDDAVLCGGRWPAGLRAEMAAADAL